MADVSDTDRGQLILITGLAIAVTLVALVLLMNTVIYTENLATRGAAVGGQDAIEYQGALAEGVGGIVDEENQENYGDWGTLTANIEAGVDEFGQLVVAQHVRRGSAASFSSPTFVEGRLVRQTSAGAFKSPGDASNWTVADNVSALRQYEMTVDPTSEATSPETGFQVSLNGTNDDVWHAYIYEDGSNDVTVAVENGTETTPTEVCSASSNEATIDLTAGTVGGEECPGLQWAKGVEAPYTVNYTYGARVQGTYNVTMEADGLDLHNGIDDGAGSGSPYWVYAVYSATFDIHYETVDLTYENEVRVAPGESA